jgi:hypothetical protein
MVALTKCQRFINTTGLPNDFQIRFSRQHGPEAFPGQEMIIGQENAKRAWRLLGDWRMIHDTLLARSAYKDLVDPANSVNIAPR